MIFVILGYIGYMKLFVKKSPKTKDLVESN